MILIVEATVIGEIAEAFTQHSHRTERPPRAQAPFVLDPTLCAPVEDGVRVHRYFEVAVFPEG